MLECSTNAPFWYGVVVELRLHCPCDARPSQQDGSIRAVVRVLTEWSAAHESLAGKKIVWGEPLHARSLKRACIFQRLLAREGAPAAPRAQSAQTRVLTFLKGS
ncbi:hypothetical protein EVAR_87375_1 [Eumeta japonica]|uniref:Uncharacterized protein n=1 Tax=Eumeta variegata TaxID=151549 RepID=A0A4C1XZM8_EUMVA|nr:hypothetical protein EVAR_87375_1 [Eumeta japonica]